MPKMLKKMKLALHLAQSNSVWTFTYHPTEGAQHLKNKKTDELGINGLISWTGRTQIISENQNL